MTWDLDTFCRTHGLGDDAAAELRDALAATLGGTAVDPDDSLLPAGAPVVRGEGRDHLSLRRLLGQGAMGEVWLAHDERLSREVALKLLGKRLAHDDGAIERFLAEARSTAQLVHPGIVPVHEVGTWSDGRPFYTMDVIRGTTLTDELATLHGGGPPEPGALHRAVERLRRACEAVGYAHARGVVHRDLKPDNVLIRDAPGGWSPVIIDLGIAKWLSEEAATATGSVFGTPHYMSPEQFRDTKHVGPATDRYALACIAFELLSGRLPFDGRNLPTLLRQHMEDPVPALHVPRRHGNAASMTLQGSGPQPVIPTPALDAFMQRAMAKAPLDRFGSSHEMAEAFKAAAQQDGIWDEPSRVAPLFDALPHPILELSGPGGKLRFNLHEGPVVVGRHEACQYVLSSPRLSRMHAVVYLHRGRLWVADMHSQNGTSCDGERLTAGLPKSLPVDGRSSTLELYDLRVDARMVPDA